MFVLMPRVEIQSVIMGKEQRHMLKEAEQLHPQSGSRDREMLISGSFFLFIHTVLPAHCTLLPTAIFNYLSLDAS